MPENNIYNQVTDILKKSGLLVNEEASAPEDITFVKDGFLVESSKNIPFRREREGGGETLPQPPTAIPRKTSVVKK